MYLISKKLFPIVLLFLLTSNIMFAEKNLVPLGFPSNEQAQSAKVGLEVEIQSHRVYLHESLAGGQGETINSLRVVAQSSDLLYEQDFKSNPWVAKSHTENNSIAVVKFTLDDCKDSYKNFRKYSCSPELVFSPLSLESLAAAYYTVGCWKRTQRSKQGKIYSLNNFLLSFNTCVEEHNKIDEDRKKYFKLKVKAGQEELEISSVDYRESDLSSLVNLRKRQGFSFLLSTTRNSKSPVKTWQIAQLLADKFINSPEVKNDPFLANKTDFQLKEIEGFVVLFLGYYG